MAGGTPRTSAAKRKRIAELHATGMGRNAIARDVGIAPSTVTSICADLGLEFDTAHSAKAVETHKLQAAEQRARIEQALLDTAEKLISQVWEPHTYIDHGGKEFTRVEWTQTEPSPVDKKHLVASAGISLDKANKLAELHKETEVDAAASMLVKLFENMAAVVKGLDS